LSSVGAAWNFPTDEQLDKIMIVLGGSVQDCILAYTCRQK